MICTTLHITVACSPYTPGFPHLGLSKLVLSSSRFPHNNEGWVKIWSKRLTSYTLSGMSVPISPLRAWGLIRYWLAQSHHPKLQAWLLNPAPTRSKRIDYIHWKDMAEWDPLQCEGNRNSFKSMIKSHLDFTSSEKGFPLLILVKPPARWLHRDGVQLCSPLLIPLSSGLQDDMEKDSKYSNFYSSCYWVLEVFNKKFNILEFKLKKRAICL